MSTRLIETPGKFHDRGRGYTMSDKIGQVKGKAKEAAGKLTGNKDLESEGKADRRAGEAKEKLSDAKGRVEKMIDKAEGKLEEVIDKSKGASHRK